jgi:signal transduction histidine kinase/FixJ family two-component response regulator
MPRRAAASRPKVGAEPLAPGPGPPSPRLRILVLDDSAEDRLLAVRTLKREFPGVDTVEIGDAETLAAALDAGGFDLALTDYVMHWTDGLKVLAAVKDRFPDCPVVMVTGTGNEEIAVEAMKSGLDDYIVKSTRHYQRLPGAISAALSRARERRHTRELERRLERLTDELEVGVYRTAIDGRFLDCNAAFQRFADEVAAGDPAQLAATLRPARGPQSGALEILLGLQPVRDIAVDGLQRERRWFSVRQAVTSQDSDSVIDGFVTDVTGQRRTDEQLRASMEQLRRIEQTVRAGVFRIVLPDWSVWWSDGTLAVLDLPPGTPAGRAALEDAFLPEIAGMLRAAMDAATKSGDIVDIDVPLKPRGEVTPWVRFFGVPHRRADGVVELSGTVHDISERKRLESEVMRAGSLERERLVSELHDNLGQILTGSALMVTSLQRAVERAGAPFLPAVRQLANAMDEASRVCRAIAHEAFSGVTDGLAAALAGLAERTTATGVACSAAAATEVDVVLAGHRALEIYRIAQEAVTNALKHAACRRIRIELVRRGQAVELLIEDDGVGLGAARGGREGLGLRTMRYRAARAGGVLALHTPAGGGTIVRVLVPAAADERSVRSGEPEL